jgi:hypothetical protein
MERICIEPFRGNLLYDLTRLNSQILFGLKVEVSGPLCCAVKGCRLGDFTGFSVMHQIQGYERNVVAASSLI